MYSFVLTVIMNWCCCCTFVMSITGKKRREIEVGFKNTILGGTSAPTIPQPATAAAVAGSTPAAEEPAVHDSSDAAGSAGGAAANGATAAAAQDVAAVPASNAAAAEALPEGGKEIGLAELDGGGDCVMADVGGDEEGDGARDDVPGSTCDDVVAMEVEDA
jgi:hypothetical protein